MGNRQGCFECFEHPNFIVSTKTGDTKGAGLHNAAHIILINEEGKHSPKIQLSGCCVTVFKKGRVDNFMVRKLPSFGYVRKIIIEQHKEQTDVEWFLERVTIKHVDDEAGSVETVFPVHRWLRMDRPLCISENDSSLPQNDENLKQRTTELNLKRIIYGFKQIAKDLPPQMKNIPRDEVFSNFYKWDVMQKRADFLTIYKFPEYDKPENWASFEEIESMFKDKGKLRRPAVLNENWRSDLHFGRQRLRGCNSKSIKLCTEIPGNFAVHKEVVEPFLEGLSLSEALERRRVFIVNHSILDDILDAESNQITPSPMALFYLNNNNDLMPVAIQLYQEKTDANPVFLPSDPEYTWLLAKMWFNNADSAYHRACLHLTSTHWLLETIALSVHRQLSPSHPIFRLLAPYIRLVLAINHFEMHPLMSPGGWIDQTTNVRVQGLLEIVKRYWTPWKFAENGCLRKVMEGNGVLDSEILPDFPYRDDSLLLLKVIHDYVKLIVEGHYDAPEKLTNDSEIQRWAAELTGRDSCNLNGVPGNGKFESRDELIQVLECIIFKTTVETASVNLPLYDEYAFVPNYPQMLRGCPPKNKKPLTEGDVMLALPAKHTTMEIIAINKILSERDASGLADPRAQYQFDEISKPARERFMGALREAAAVITVRNRKRKIYYDYLNPASSKTILT